MEAPSPFSVYGGLGFIGSEICKNPSFVSNENTRDDRDKLPSKYPDLVYLISTIHNYHVLDNDPYVDIATNLHHLISVLQSNRIKYGNDFTVTFVSSWFVYGKTECPAIETSPCSPTGFYSITKHCAEQLLQSYCETFGIKWKIVRLSNVMGQGDMKISARKNALQYMIRELSLGRSIKLYEEDCKRDYLHVSDAAEAIRKVARSGKFGEIYNIGSGKPHSIHNLVRRAYERSGEIGTIEVIPVPDFHKVVQVKDMWLDCTKINTELGWSPILPIEGVVEDLVEYYMKGGE